MIKFRIGILFVFLLVNNLLASCHHKSNNSEIKLPKIENTKIISTKNKKYIESNDFKIYFIQSESGYYVSINNSNENIFYQNFPARIIVRNNDTLSNGEFIEEEFTKSYHSVIKEKYGFRAIAEIKTLKGSIFTVEDKYSILSNGVFAIYRDVKVKKAGKGDAGFASNVSFVSKTNSQLIDEFEYFIPSVLYRNTMHMRETAVAADLNAERMYVKETRSGLPLAMLNEKKTGNSLTLMHLNPKIDVNHHPGGGVPGEINDALQYGSIGYTLHPKLSVDFHYPCAEGPRTYEFKQKNTNNASWSKRYHLVNEGNEHNYSLAIIPNKFEDYNDAIVEVFTKAFETENPKIVSMNIDNIYNQNIDLFKAEYKEFGNGNIVAAGLPWSLDLPDGKNSEGISFQMGFVGQQIAVGYHLYRYGLDNNDAECIRKGKTIVDFWVSEPIMGTYFPTVWWDPSNNETAGQRRDYPSFLRCFVDGMEGLLDAYRISAAYGVPQKQWDIALRRVASNLVNKQNKDGSFYRAYKPNGNVETVGDRNTHGTSKLNTPVAVRFLVKMYEHTGEEKYKIAAIKAAEYSYNEIYIRLGKYVGGTPDNPNTVDKEAAIFALYCFNSIHELTGDMKYLKAAEHAAISAMSWTYCYDFAIPNSNKYDTRRNPFVNGGITGFSLIATGHSGADNFISYMFYEMYKLYIKTGKDQYLYMAKFLQNNTKLNTDYDGRMKYKYKAFMPEATNVADLKFRSVSLWLPWASIANIEPIVNLEEAFGKKDILEINETLEDLRVQLFSYGIGGKPLER